LSPRNKLGHCVNMRQSGSDYAYLYDGKGNVISLLDPLQSVVAAYAYDPFGVLMKKSGTFDQPFMFSTKPYDEALGHSKYDFRTYVPSLGKWATRDPMGEAGGYNLYGFVGNSPMSMVDPLGLYKEDVHFYKTLNWALKAHIDSRIAIRIAAADQKVDDALLSKPENPLNWLFGLSFHFQSRQYAEVGLAQSIDQGDIEQFGKFLHILQDSFAHEGFGFPLGHIRKGDKPDEYCENNKRDTDMRELTILWLKKFEKRIGKLYHPIIRGVN